MIPSSYSVLLFLILVPIAILSQKIPVIGVYTQDSSSYPGKTYLFSSPPKYLQLAGAQVVPIHYKSTNDELRQILSQINGVLFPGGNISFDINTQWTKNADFILKYAIEQNQLGNVYPIYGICQGHQLLSYLTCGYDSKVLQTVDKETPTVNTIEFVNYSSYILTNLTKSNFQKISTQPGVIQYDHYWAVYLTYFNSNSQLNSFWNLIGTTTTVCCNQTYTTMMEAKKYPFYTVQFHAESNLFNIRTDEERNNFEAVEIAQRLIQAFVEKSRLNKNEFKSKEDLYGKVVQNYPMTPFNRATMGKQSYLMD